MFDLTFLSVVIVYDRQWAGRTKKKKGISLLTIVVPVMGICYN